MSGLKRLEITVCVCSLYKTMVTLCIMYILLATAVNNVYVKYVYSIYCYCSILNIFIAAEPDV